MINIKRFIFSIVLAMSLITTNVYAEQGMYQGKVELVDDIITTKAYEEPITKILKEGIHKFDVGDDITANFRNISSTDMTVIVLTPLKYLKLYTDLNINAKTSTKTITKEDVIIVVGSGEVVMEYNYLE